MKIVVNLLILLLILACKRDPDPPPVQKPIPQTTPQTPAPQPDVQTPPPPPKPVWKSPPPSERQGYVRPKLIDFHAHLGLDGVDRLQQIMAENGIETMVNLSGGSYRRGPSMWLESQMLAETTQKDSQNQRHVLNFMNPDWSGFGTPGWGEREAARLEDSVKRYGFRGLKIAKILGLGAIDETTGKLVAVDDPRLNPLWQKCGDLGIPITIHVADPRAFWWPLDPQNERWDELKVHPGWAYGPMAPELAAQLPKRPPVPSWTELLQAAERMYRANPRTTYIAVHFGNAAEDIDYVDGLLARNDNVYIDLAARVGEFGRHPAEKLRAFFLKWQDRIVFGTDIGVGADYLMLGSNGEIEPQLQDVRPFYEAHFRFFETDKKQIDHPSPIQGNWKVDAINLPDDVLLKIYRENGLKLLDQVRLKAFAEQKHRDLKKVPLGVPDGKQRK